MKRISHWLASVLFAFSTVGCSGNIAVTGSVLYADGTPVEEGMVIAELKEPGKSFAARGNLAKDGTFSLGITAPNEGIPAGVYKVLVVPRSLIDSEKNTTQPAIDSRFEKYETSGLEFEVKPGSNFWKIAVTKPAPKVKKEKS